MAKNGAVKWISITIVIVGLLVGIVGTWTVYGEDIAQTTEDVSKLTTEGCEPARQHTTDIALIQQDIEYIKKAQDKGFEAILKKLK